MGYYQIKERLGGWMRIINGGARILVQEGSIKPKDYKMQYVLYIFVY